MPFRSYSFQQLQKQKKKFGSFNDDGSAIIAPLTHTPDWLLKHGNIYKEKLNSGSRFLGKCAIFETSISIQNFAFCTSLYVKAIKLIKTDTYFKSQSCLILN